MRKDGKENDQHKGQSRTLEGIQKVCDRSRQGSIGHIGNHDKGKNKEIELLFCLLVDSLDFSGEYLAKCKEVLIDAIMWYRRAQIEEEKWTEQYLDDARLSLLPDLKKRIESGEGVSGSTGNLLAKIVKEYLDHLPKLEQKPWINKETIERQKDQLAEIMADSLPRGTIKPKLHSA